jgi:glycosyltransferase involved in cell wall biosynthesis
LFVKRNWTDARRILVIPGIWYENFPRTLVEAFACGLPVIASRSGALAELVHEGNYSNPVQGKNFPKKSLGRQRIRMRWDEWERGPGLNTRRATRRKKIMNG